MRAWKLTILILTCPVVAVPATLGFEEVAIQQAALRDGFFLRGVEGRLTAEDANGQSRESEDRWFFEFDSDVSDGRRLVKSGKRLELLPSAILEKMTADAKEGFGADYRLWGRVTKYKGRNFIFPTDFWALRTVETSLGRPSQEGSAATPEPPGSQQLQEQQGKPDETPPTEEGRGEPAISEPNDIVTVPQEIIDRLKSRRVVQHKDVRLRPQAKEKVEEDSNSAGIDGLELQAGAGPRLREDWVLADRSGFIRECGGEAEGPGRQLSFVLDAFGWNVQRERFGLLPCEVLELAEAELSREPEPLRFKAAGIVATYKGKKYLLLYKATRVYNYGNFGR